jgi:hypothetical protein
MGLYEKTWLVTGRLEDSREANEHVTPGWALETKSLSTLK